MDKKSQDKIIQAGKIAAEVKKYARTIVKKNVPLLEIADKIEEKIIELGGMPAFPVNLSINEIAAHYTPVYDDKTLTHGLLKVDLGVHIDGFLADTAFSVDLENSETNKKLIEASEKALENAIKNFEKGVQLRKIGETVEKTISSFSFNPVSNLSGHAMEQGDLHAGVNIPNVATSSTNELEEGLYAIEPFATTGNGKVYDAKPSGIYAMVEIKNIRSESAREILSFIAEEYGELPFCARWLVKKFGTKALFALKQLEENGNLHQFPQLTESSNGIVSQSEHTVLVLKDKVIVTTE